MQDYKLNYWIEAIQSSADNNNISLPDDIIKKMAVDMVNAAEMQGQAFGHDIIPSPRIAEKDSIVKNMEAKIKYLEAQVMAYKQSVATRRRVSVENVYLENGYVMYDRI